MILKYIYYKNNIINNEYCATFTLDIPSIMYVIYTYVNRAKNNKQMKLNFSQNMGVENERSLVSFSIFCSYLKHLNILFSCAFGNKFYEICIM